MVASANVWMVVRVGCTPPELLLVIEFTAHAAVKNFDSHYGINVGDPRDPTGPRCPVSGENSFGPTQKNFMPANASALPGSSPQDALAVRTSPWDSYGRRTLRSDARAEPSRPKRRNTRRRNKLPDSLSTLRIDDL
jgi:hypothetical protein